MKSMKTTTNKNAWLAKKVMGWTIMKPSGVIVFANNQRSSMTLDDWNPDKDIKQAFMLLEHQNVWNIEFRYSDYKVEIGDDIHANALVLSEAITEAVLKVSGYYEN